jgi:internalin A
LDFPDDLLWAIFSETTGQHEESFRQAIYYLSRKTRGLRDARAEAAKWVGPSQLDDPIPLLHRCSNLRSIDISNCKDISNLEALHTVHLPALTSLDISGCLKIEDLSPLAVLGDLSSLNCNQCTRIYNLGPLNVLDKLSYLNFDHCSMIKDLLPLSKLTLLSTLRINEIGRRQSFPVPPGDSPWGLERGVMKDKVDLTPLSKLTSLQRLHCIENQLQHTSTLFALTNLITLEITFLEDDDEEKELEEEDNSFTALCGISSLTALTKLSFNAKSSMNVEYGYASEVDDLSYLSTLTALKSLSFAGCHCVTDLEPVSYLSNLIALDFSRCFSIKDISPLSALTSLTHLDCSDCTSIKDMRPLSRLTSLTRLDCLGCNRSYPRRTWSWGGLA